jgi:hypothetical protein
MLVPRAQDSLARDGQLLRLERKELDRADEAVHPPTRADELATT